MLQVVGLGERSATALRGERCRRGSERWRTHDGGGDSNRSDRNRQQCPGQDSLHDGCFLPCRHEAGTLLCSLLRRGRSPCAGDHTGRSAQTGCRDGPSRCRRAPSGRRVVHVRRGPPSDPDRLAGQWCVTPPPASACWNPEVCRWRPLVGRGWRRGRLGSGCGSARWRGDADPGGWPTTSTTTCDEPIRSSCDQRSRPADR